MRIGVAGYYGYGNLGDEWFLMAWRDLFAGPPSDLEAVVSRKERSSRSSLMAFRDLVLEKIR